MARIGLISDTHGYIDEAILKHFSDCDEIWHAGDFGKLEVAQKLSELKPLKGVYGNIDGSEIRIIYPEELIFEIEGFKIWMIHIGGYPGHYNPKVRNLIPTINPDIFICGHSHILKVQSDTKNNNMLTINPGAAGKHGFHKIRTIMKFDLKDKKIENMKAIELGKRA